MSESRPSNDAPEADELLIARLEEEMLGFTAERDASVTRCRELLAAEDPQNGVFHAQEIFRLQQDKLRLEVEMELRRKKINRIRLGMAEDAAQNAGGLLF